MRVLPTNRRATGRLLVALSSGWLIFAALPAWGGPRDIAVRIACPSLSDVSAAEFEARTKVDLSARSRGGGELEVVCDELSARIRWRERGGAWFARSLPPTATPATLIDALLVASKELVEDASHFEKSASGDAGKDEGGTTDQVPPSAAAASNAEVGDRTLGRAGESLPTGKPAGDRPAQPESTASSERSSAASGTPPRWAWGVSAGTQAALFTLRGTGMVGPSVGVFVELPAGFVASLTGEYDVALGAGDVVSVRVAGASGVIGVPFGPSRAFEVGVGGWVGSLFASSEAPYQPTSQAEAFWGVIVRGRYALRTDAWRFAVGPDVRFHGFRPEIAVDHAAVWGVPVVSVGLALEVSRDLYGSR